MRQPTSIQLIDFRLDPQFSLNCFLGIGAVRCGSTLVRSSQLPERWRKGRPDFTAEFGRFRVKLDGRPDVGVGAGWQELKFESLCIAGGKVMVSVHE